MAPRSRRALLVSLVAVASLLVGWVSLHALTLAAAAPAAPSSPAATSLGKARPFVSYQPPHERRLATEAYLKAGVAAGPFQREQARRAILQTWSRDHYHGPRPADLDRRLDAERQATRSGKSVADLGLAVSGSLRLLAIPIEFAGQDRVENLSYPRPDLGAGVCVTETVTFSGPLHNQIRQPGPRDNQTFWLPDFSRDYYQRILFTNDGWTARVRPDLKDPADGQPGIDIARQTVKGFYEEASSGRITFDGGPRGALDWIRLPHSEAYYGASICTRGVPGSGDQGLPSNPRFGFGPPTLVEDAVKIIQAADPTFPWADYDTDGDHVIDHVVLFHAGQDESVGGGAQGGLALWAHRAEIDPERGGYVVDDRGTPDPGDDIRITSYTLQPEDAGPGIIIHEFGHDLGLPDLYDTTYQGETSVTWWDSMAFGAYSGKLFQSHPAQLSAWSKVVLGWATPQVIAPTTEGATVVLGEAVQPPTASTQVVQVNLPETRIDYVTLPPASTQAWWTGNDQNWADVRLVRDLDLTGVSGPISFTFQTNYAIETDWDYMFVEVSVDAGQTFTPTRGLRVGTHQEVTTPTDYPDPNGRLAAYGGLRHGYTGRSVGWLAVYHDLSPYAGQSIQLRVRYATDTGVLERGAFLDNLAVRAGATVVFEDAVEGGDAHGWSVSVGSFNPSAPLGDGWRLSDGGDRAPLYYLLEWRSFKGFDAGLRYTYNDVYATAAADGAPEWHVERVPANLPGMLVWLRDMRYGRSAAVVSQSIMGDDAFFGGPSEGPKGGLLLVDAHPDPLRMNINWLYGTPYGWFLYPPWSNWLPRVQTVNAAFSLQATPPLTLTYAMSVDDLRPTRHDPLPAVAAFHDSLGYYPGVEALPTPVVVADNGIVRRAKPYALSQHDAGVVVPARGYYSPRTPAGFTGVAADSGAAPATDETMFLRPDYSLASMSIGRAGDVDVAGQRSGHPGDDRLQHGWHVQLLSQAGDGSTATVRVWNTARAGDTAASISRVGPRLRVTATLTNTGEVDTPLLVSDFDEDAAVYVEGSASAGVTPVVEGGRVVALSRSAALGSSVALTFSYELAPLVTVDRLTVVTRAFTSAVPSLMSETTSVLDPIWWRQYLPSLLRSDQRPP